MGGEVAGVYSHGAGEPRPWPSLPLVAQQLWSLVRVARVEAGPVQLPHARLEVLLAKLYRLALRDFLGVHTHASLVHLQSFSKIVIYFHSTVTFAIMSLLVRSYMFKFITGFRKK